MRISDWSSDVCSSDLRIWRPEDRSGATDEGPGEGEPAASPCDIGPDAGQADIAGGCPGKLLSPARRRRCIDHIRTMMPVSERRVCRVLGQHRRSEEHTSELQSLMRISYAVFCLKKKKNLKQDTINK